MYIVKFYRQSTDSYIRIEVETIDEDILQAPMGFTFVAYSRMRMT